jgi:hypothetical protein
MNLAHAQLVLGLAVVLGCEYPQGSQEYDVTATLYSSTCGTGAVDADDNLSFQVEIERDDDILTWDDGDNDSVIEVTIDDEEFVLAASSTYVITATDGTTSCAVVRRDRYEGSIDGSGDYIDKIEGELTYTFSQATGYDCDDLIGATNGFDDLPCTVTYTFVASPAD